MSGSTARQPSRNLDHPSLIADVLADGMIRYRFFRSAGWHEVDAQETLVHQVLAKMRDKGCYSVIKVERAQTKAVGPETGVASALEIVDGERGPFIAVNGGFFIHYPRLYLDIEHGGLLPDSRLYQSVGDTTLSQNYVSVPPAYKHELLFRKMSDGSGFTAGPSLRDPLAVATPTFTQINTILGRFSHFAHDRSGRKIPSPLWESFVNWDKQYDDLLRRKGTTVTVENEKESLAEAGKFEFYKADGSVRYAASAPDNKYIRSYWARVPGNLAHVMEPNERSGVSQHNDTWLFHAYTCDRDDGLTMNEFRTLIQAGAVFLGLTLDKISTQQAWANDGGPSIFQLFVAEDGTMTYLAQGGQSEQNTNAVINSPRKRQVPNAIVARSL
ncbi:hypothetical protein [Rhizobium rhizogenes]|uniref:hypothetical protein n=2 Tax=Rhizobium rhizogenes TaxID=359 RepID=UPI0022C2F0A4|nr:hypothetical protein [Rhizobium rhizogenes]MCZ7465712.1 hypothetical protein [Rhizobium rhizogenes]